MISIFKKNSIRFKVLTTVFLLTLIIFTITGCGNSKKAAPVDTKKVMSSDENTESIQILTGKVDVEGKGVSITLTDKKTDKKDVESMHKGIIHDSDIIEIILSLKQAGVEVISINDERLIPISKIKANKMMIRVNNNDCSSPFIIKAIGDPDVLNNELNKDSGYIIERKKNIGIKIEKKDKLLIPKYKGNIQLKYAKPVKKEKN